MVLQSAYSFSDAASPTVEVSKETLGSILFQIETELYNSEIYRRAMAGFQTMLGESVGTAHIMVKAVGREAIRLAFQQLARQYKVVPVASPDSTSIKNIKEEQPITSASVVQEEAIAPKETAPDQLTSDSNQDHLESLEGSLDSDDLEELLKPFGLTSTLPDSAKTLKKPTQEELAEEKAFQVREECLRQIGQEIMQARQLRSMSQDQLHRQTLVPLYHIEALETGRVDKLPEDVYVRSFIRLLGNAVGLDGAAISANLPESDLVKSVVPSWYKTKSASGLSLTPVH